jgi:hypothetical protein
VENGHWLYSMVEREASSITEDCAACRISTISVMVKDRCAECKPLYVDVKSLRTVFGFLEEFKFLEKQVTKLKNQNSI